ncbi:MAG: hypothetical protein IS860_08600 [Nitrosopumilus sp.]|nr:hypothetical protein [Nitrosopumilus sp.]MCE2506214.1 hypothetical protein [Nitrosopumilaceae archaeon]
MKTRLLIILGIIMMATIPFVTFAALDRYSDYVEHVDAVEEQKTKAPKPGDKYYIEPERKAKLDAVELDLRDRITQLHQKESLSSFAVNLDHRTQEIIVMVEKDHFNAEIEKIISEYPEDIQIVFFNGRIYLDEWSEPEIASRSEKYLDENNDLNFALQYDKNGIIIDDLQRIHDWCDYLGEKPTHWYFDWNNSTHHIDSNNCEWIKTEKDLIEHMKNAAFDKEGGHYDYLPINDNPNMMAMEKIQLQDNDSINVEFGQNNYEWSTGYKPIPEFEYHANFKVNDTFVVLCTNIGKDGYADAHPDLSEPYLPRLGILKYLGPMTIENELILLFWHESASIQVDIPCSYPEMIYHSINLWNIQEQGLPTDSIVNALGSNYQK